MGGKVPAEDMLPERVQLLERAWAANSSMKKFELLALIEELAKAAHDCPRTSCAFCEHIARSERDRVKEVLQGE